jgi:putative transposase
MARLPRLIIPLPHYVIQRGSNRQPVFQDAADYAQFLSWLKTGAKMYKVAIHAYVLCLITCICWPRRPMRRAWAR